jgi:hypothetical protein
VVVTVERGGDAKDVTPPFRNRAMTSPVQMTATTTASFCHLFACSGVNLLCPSRLGIRGSPSLVPRLLRCRSFDRIGAFESCSAERLVTQEGDPMATPPRSQQARRWGYSIAPHSSPLGGFGPTGASSRRSPGTPPLLRNKMDLGAPGK